jgi:hypothetical protein
MRDGAVVLDQGLALIDKEFSLAIRAQELDAGVAQILVMDMEFLAAFGTAGIEMLDHWGTPCWRCLFAFGLGVLKDERERAGPALVFGA